MELEREHAGAAARMSAMGRKRTVRFAATPVKLPLTHQPSKLSRLGERGRPRRAGALGIEVPTP